MATDPANPPAPTSQQSYDELAIRSARAAAAQRARVVSDTNGAPARPEFDKASGVYVYETIPVPLKQLFASPLAQNGPLASGPQAQRLLLSGWGATLPAGLSSTGAINQALDYAGVLSEPVFAAAAGTVRFVGYQASKGFATVVGPRSNETARQILDANGNIVATASSGAIGFGGIAAWIGHTGNFQGYQTEYYRLSNVVVANGDTVSQGQLIGHVGGSGGPGGWTKTNLELRFQIVFTSGGLRAIVPPTALVPNYWPGHLDSTNASQATNILMPLIAAVGGQVAASRVANIISSMNRATTIQNKGVKEVKQDQSNYAARTAQTVEVQRTAVYAAAAGFQGMPPVVTSPMTFDFANGVWLVNGQNNGVV